ncbi:MAG: family 10 glycosylhydrolase, partial [Patescibacteria group bacterium]|nr:family 10 glycosylhydrolase [Patescibacteria group bacterium]
TFTHNTKVGEVFDTTEEIKHPDNTRRVFSKLAFGDNKTGEFIKQGTDPLKIMVEFCKKNDIEVFWTMRMNDTHDAAGPGTWYGNGVVLNQLKRDHPEWLLGGETKRVVKGRWTAVDYGRREIRDLALKYVEEVCENYDVDGVELDFCRHLNYFKRPAMGEDANQEDCDQMTDLIRSIREMTERVGLQRGRPILVAVRVPDSVGYCKAMGFDIEKWMRDGLIDMMAVSDYFRLNPWETSVALGHKYGVKVFACLSETRLRDAEARKTRGSTACYRARAMNAWHAGVDAVYLFNSFDPRSPLWRELGDPAGLQALDRVYTTGARDVRGAESWLKDGMRFLNRTPVSPHQPLALTAGTPAPIELRVGESIAESKGQNGAPKVELSIRLVGIAGPEQLSTELNGTLLTDGKLVDGRIEYPVEPALVQEGVNRFTLTLDPACKDKVKVEDLLLWVRCE